MLSYLHHFHAGNHADVLKHWVLLECLAYMQQKERGMDVIDTHAGAGVYRLDSAQAQKTAEFEQGIVKAMAVPGLERLTGFMTPYLKNRRYAGSAEIIRSQLRPQDRAWLYELHPQSFAELSRLGTTRSIRIRQEDGFQALPALLPGDKKRALAIMDPPYEVKTDYRKAAEAATQAWRRLPGATILIWYPVVCDDLVNQLLRSLKSGAVKDVLRLELGVRPAGGMYASGMLVINPPWTLQQTAELVLPEVAAALKEQGEGFWMCEEFIGE